MILRDFLISFGIKGHFSLWSCEFIVRHSRWIEDDMDFLTIFIFEIGRDQKFYHIQETTAES